MPSDWVQTQCNRPTEHPPPARTGIVRLCGAPYSVPKRNNLRRQQVHLTNWSLNKVSAAGGAGFLDPNACSEDELRLREQSGACPMMGAGLKRSLAWFRQHVDGLCGGDWRSLVSREVVLPAPVLTLALVLVLVWWCG